MNPNTSKTAPRPRDLRLDFFRGLGMFIIFIAHVPANPWKLWIPARFGASDATEIFVFCSGMASAIAFGAVFRDRSWWMGTARVAYRCWQVYWAHIILFVVVVATLCVFNDIRGDDYYTGQQLYVQPFLDDTANHLIALLTLNYVPNYFDILPMYLVMLAMMPVVVWLGLKNRWYAFAFVAALWLGAQAGYLHFSAEVRPGIEREWFFNPFGWQLVFFTGFAFMMGWIKPPPFSWWLIGLAVLILILNVAFASKYYWRHQWIPLHELAMQPYNKTDQGLYRFTHFLALAYLAWLLAGEGGRRLAGGGLWGGFVHVVRRVGQQSLAVFLAGMALAPVVGAALDVTGRTALTLTAGNLFGFACLIATAYVARFFKSQPWRRPPGEPVRPAPSPAPAPVPARDSGGGKGFSAQPAE